MPPLPQSERPLIGRTAELAELSELVMGGGASSAVLLGGDAGVGKTRLLTEIAARARGAGVRVLLGHCLDLGDSSAPYLPWSEMFARLAQDEPDRARALATDRPLLTGLLPEYYRRAAPADLPSDRGSFFDSVHMTLEELAEESPVLAIVEDAHWADRSTRELLTFLFTRRFRGPVVLVVSYRSDDLNRRHPLRSKLAEWARLPGMHRIALAPLSDTEVADLLRLLRPAATTGDTASIVARAGGNPFFAEELLAASELGRRGLPDELADLLLVRIDALDDHSRSVVRAASVAGRGIDHALLAQVVALPVDELDAALRTIVDGHVFQITSTGGYAFRHALLAEAVYDDLLPGERVRLHGQFAEALRDRTGAAGAADLARHARAAGLLGLALVGSVQAGDAAMAASGPADAARHFEDALSLLAEHPETPSPFDQVDLVVRATRALVAAGNPHRALDVGTEAYRHHDGPLPDRARLVAALSEARLLTGEPESGGALVREAIGWLTDIEPTPTLAQLYAIWARTLIVDDDFDGAMLAAIEGQTLARDLDLPEVVTDVLTSLARLDDFAGDSARSIAALREIVERARAASDVPAEMRGLHQLARVQMRMEEPRRAMETMLEAVERSEATGFRTDPFAVDSRVLATHDALMLGEWSLADRLLEPGDLHLSAVTAASLAVMRLVRDAGRGIDQVLDTLPALRPLWPRDMFVAVHAAGVAIDVHGAAGDLDRMLAVHDDIVETIRSTWRVDDFDARIRLSALALGHLASAVIAGRASPAQVTARARSLREAVDDVVGKRSSEAALGAESRAWTARARAEFTRLEWGGVGSASDELVADWRSAIGCFETAEIPYEAARSKFRLAEALASRGERGPARELLDEVREVAERLGARPLLEATRSRSGGSAERGPSARITLTPRERQVLGLVAEGRTNGEIAGLLFISTKTASVHVSNILSKLGAATRTEAAAMATREGLLD